MAGLDPGPSGDHRGQGAGAWARRNSPLTVAVLDAGGHLVALKREDRQAGILAARSPRARRGHARHGVWRPRPRGGCRRARGLPQRADGGVGRGRRAGAGRRADPHRPGRRDRRLGRHQRRRLGERRALRCRGDQGRVARLRHGRSGATGPSLASCRLQSSRRCSCRRRRWPGRLTCQTIPSQQTIGALRRFISSRTGRARATAPEESPASTSLWRGARPPAHGVMPIAYESPAGAATVAGPGNVELAAKYCILAPGGDWPLMSRSVPRVCSCRAPPPARAHRTRRCCYRCGWRRIGAIGRASAAAAAPSIAATARGIFARWAGH